MSLTFQSYRTQKVKFCVMSSDAKLRIAVQQHISILQSGTAEQKVKALKELNAHSAAWLKVAAWIIEEGGVDPLIEIMCGGMETPRESARSTLVRITMLATRSEGSKVCVDTCMSVHM